MADTYATLETSKGPIRVRLFPDSAPKTVENRRGLIVGEPSCRWALAPWKTTSRSAAPATATGRPDPSWTSWST